VASPFERPRRPWATGGGGGGFFRGIARAGIVKTLNSFNFDVLGDIKWFAQVLALNAI
jgi:hypothetical protein